MAQKILLRRGGLASINSAATIAVSKGEQLFASGTLANTTIENITFIANADGNNGFQAVGRLFSGTASPTSFNSRLNGLPYYKTDTQALHILGDGTALDLTGNLEGNTVSAMTITTLTGTTIDLSGDITGSNLLLSGNANIDGNIVLGGNITIGDANTDNISLGGEFTSDLIPDADDTYAIGSGTRRWNLYGVNSSITGSFSGSFAGTFDDGLAVYNIAGGNDGSGTDLVNTGETVTFTNASTHGFYFSITDNTVTLNTPQDLRTTASPSFAGATAGNIKVGVTGDNEIDTTSGNLTIDSAGGTVTVDDNLTVTGATVTLSSVPAGTDNTVLVLNSSNQVVTDEIDPRVWGTTLIDGSGTLTAGRVPYVSDANTLTDDAGLTYNAGTDVLSVGSSTFGTNVSIAGDLTVSGTTTTIDSTTVNIGDNIIVLNAAGTVADGGVQVIDTTGTVGTGSLLWNATNDYWYAGISGSTHYRVATYTNATPSTNAVPRVDSNKRLVAGSITDTTTAVTISQPTTLQSSLEVDGIVQLDNAGGSDDGNNTSAVSFRNQSNQIGYISTTEGTDVLDGILGYKSSDGTLVFSTVIDGGTF